MGNSLLSEAFSGLGLAGAIVKTKELLVEALRNPLEFRQSDEVIAGVIWSAAQDQTKSPIYL